jgi:hypothetical protein
VTVAVKQIVDECGDVARERWRFYYERGLHSLTVTAATADADASVIAEYERGVLVPSKQVTATRISGIILRGIREHTTPGGDIPKPILVRFLTDFDKVARDLP